jgi:hypothetical protein
MNFRWVTKDNTEEADRAVILHEFGHAIGLIHEHNHPKSGIVWNEKRVIADMAKQRWDEEMVKFNIFNVYERPAQSDKPDSVTAPVDRKSIMMYPIAGGWATNKDRKPYVVGWNTQLSEDDKVFIAAQYPKPRR